MVEDSICPLGNGRDCNYCVFCLVKEIDGEVQDLICTYGMDDEEVRRLQLEEGYRPCG